MPARHAGVEPAARAFPNPCSSTTQPSPIRQGPEEQRGCLSKARDGEEPQVNSLRRHPNSCPKGLLAAVADGMVGPLREVASREGLASIALYLFGHWGRFPGDRGLNAARGTLLGAAEVVPAAVLRYSDHHRPHGLHVDRSVIWEATPTCRVWDSRAYSTANERVQLTQDQTSEPDDPERHAAPWKPSGIPSAA